MYLPMTYLSDGANSCFESVHTRKTLLELIDVVVMDTIVKSTEADDDVIDMFHLQAVRLHYR